jgi:hypothetical protein
MMKDLMNNMFRECLRWVSDTHDDGKSKAPGKNIGADYLQCIEATIRRESE